jgi:hypothetical protein
LSIPGQFPRRFSRAAPATASPPGGATGDGAPGAPDAGVAPRSWPWRRAALPASVAAFAPAPVARLAGPLAVAVLVTGMMGQVAHTAVFFLPALAR